MEFPLVKPYDKSNTISKQLALFIPKGPKFFAWFTYSDNKPICLFVDKDGYKTHHYVSFKEELSIGTLLYGTMIHNYFVCEHIYLFQNEKVMNSLNSIKNVLEMIKDSDYLGSISFKIPHMASNSILLECSNLPYTVYGIVQNSRMFKIQNILGGFLIKKRSECEDVYELFTLNDKEFIFYSTALVNDFKTSHFLKSLFYKKKTTYKSIEFSDSEDEEYENEVFVGCLFIQEFKKWKPYGFKNPDPIKTIQFLEKKNIMV